MKFSFFIFCYLYPCNLKMYHESVENCTRAANSLSQQPISAIFHKIQKSLK